MQQQRTRTVLAVVVLVLVLVLVVGTVLVLLISADFQARTFDVTRWTLLDSEPGFVISAKF